MNRKRQIIEHLLEDLHEQYWNYIESALEWSDMKESKDIINYIKNKK